MRAVANSEHFVVAVENKTHVANSSKIDSESKSELSLAAYCYSYLSSVIFSSSSLLTGNKILSSVTGYFLPNFTLFLCTQACSFDFLSKIQIFSNIAVNLLSWWLNRESFMVQTSCGSASTVSHATLHASMGKINGTFTSETKGTSCNFIFIIQTWMAVIVSSNSI